MKVSIFINPSNVHVITQLMTVMKLWTLHVSYTCMSIFNDFDEIVTYCKDMFHGRIMNDFSVLIIDSTTADNHASTLGTGTNDLEKDTGAYTNLYYGQVQETFGLIGKYTDTGNITAKIGGSNFDHKSCVSDT